MELFSCANATAAIAYIAAEEVRQGYFLFEQKPTPARVKVRVLSRRLEVGGPPGQAGGGGVSSGPAHLSNHLVSSL